MSEHASAHAEHEEHDHGGVAKYIYVFIALCLLTTASFMTYSDFWRDRMPIEVGRAFMLAIACAKAMLVILFFMHVKYEANWKYVLTIPPGIMAIFLMLALVPDIGMRETRVSPERRLHMAEPVHLEEMDDHGEGADDHEEGQW